MSFCSFFCKKSDKSDFSTIKILANFGAKSLARSQITHERARIANALSTRVFDGFSVKTEQQNRKTGHENQGKRPAFTP